MEKNVKISTINYTKFLDQVTCFDIFNWALLFDRCGGDAIIERQFL